jgi:hypothetical protein
MEVLQGATAKYLNATDSNCFELLLSPSKSRVRYPVPKRQDFRFREASRLQVTEFYLIADSLLP